VTSPASGAGSAPDPPRYAPIPQSAPGLQSVTGRAASPATAAGGGRRLGLALLVIATAQLMVVLDATIVNVALPHVQGALGFSGTGLEWVVNAYDTTIRPDRDRKRVRYGPGGKPGTGPIRGSGLR